MKPARTLFSLLTVATASVGVTSAQFVTSTTTTTRTTPGLAPRSNDIATLDAREDRETVRVTRTIVQNGRTSSTRPRPSSTKKKNDDDDDDGEMTTRRTSQSRSQISTATHTTDDSTSSITATTGITDSPTTPPDNNDTEGEKQDSSGSGLSAGAAAGIAAATVAVVAIIAAIGFLLWRRRQGGIRGAVVTGDYPQGMSDIDNGDPKMPPDGDPDGNGQQQHHYPVGIEEGHDFQSGVTRRSDSDGSGETLYKIPPAGTMPGEPGFEYPGDYPQQQQQQQHQWPGGDLGETRPVSAFTAYPSPGLPILPVSPMTPYRPDSSILMAGQHQSQLRISSYYPEPGSPGPPAYLIPGGNRSRALSFSSVAHVGGGPHVAELVGSPPPPSAPSVAVVVEEELWPTRRSHAELP